MTECFIFDIQRFSIHDGPGIRTTVFFKGCPLSCPWCHNPESRRFEPDLLIREDHCLLCGVCREACPHGAISKNETAVAMDRTACRACGACATACPTRAREIAGTPVSISALLAELKRDLPFFAASGGGVTASGGEPLAQPQALAQLFKACKERGIHTAVDTSGFAPPEVISRVAQWTDLFLFDLKCADSDAHQRYTGVANTQILKNLIYISEIGIETTVRIPLIPGITDTADNVVGLAEVLRRLGPHVAVQLLPFHSLAANKYKRLGLMPHSLWSHSATDISAPTPVDIAEKLRALGIHRVTING
ncbi:MAG: glycyl-radical enzyme activating protein [Myxococcota bacterium]|nr:glycyl-radical enzyme activating protein [Myxococcota bacterium]